MPAPKEPSEYGGKPGIIQSSADGHTLDAAEMAMLIRSEGRRGAGMDTTIPADDAHRPEVDAYLKDRAERFGGYTADDAV